MSRIRFWKRLFVPTYDNPGHIQCGEIAFDYAKCKRDSLCTQICPADSIVTLEDKRPSMKEAQMSECIAVCPHGTILLRKPFKVLRGYFKTIDQGEISPVKPFEKPSLELP